MFGYIAINKAEMKFKDYDVYQAYYCGLCRRLKECYGKRGQLTLSYDMTFLIVLLTGLYEPKTITGEIRCIAHPLEKHPTKINEYTDYAASMNLILSYYKCKDDWTDERKKKGYIAAKALEPKIKKIESNYPEKVRLIHSKLEEINQYEKKVRQILTLWQDFSVISWLKSLPGNQMHGNYLFEKSDSSLANSFTSWTPMKM